MDIELRKIVLKFEMQINDFLIRRTHLFFVINDPKEKDSLITTKENLQSIQRAKESECAIIVVSKGPRIDDRIIKLSNEFEAKFIEWNEEAEKVIETGITYVFEKKIELMKPEIIVKKRKSGLFDSVSNDDDFIRDLK